jgi:hypothetical protein
MTPEEAAQEQLDFYNAHLTKQRGFEAIETPPGEMGWRTHSLKSEFAFGPVVEHGIGYYVYNKETGEVCEHTNEWFLEGQVLLCTTCYFEGT